MKHVTKRRIDLESVRLGDLLWLDVKGQKEVALVLDKSRDGGGHIFSIQALCVIPQRPDGYPEVNWCAANRFIEYIAPSCHPDLHRLDRLLFPRRGD